jgi:hypothetical protein
MEAAMDSAAPADAALELRAEEEGAAKLRAEVDAEVASMSAAALGGASRSTLANGCAVSVADRFFISVHGHTLAGINQNYGPGGSGFLQ